MLFFLAFRAPSLLRKVGSVAGVVLFLLLIALMSLFYRLGDDIVFTSARVDLRKNRITPIIELVGDRSSGPWAVRLSQERKLMPGLVLVKEHYGFGEFYVPVSTPSLKVLSNDTILLDLIPAPDKSWEPTSVKIKPFVYY